MWFLNISGAGRGRRGNPCKHNAGPAPRLRLRLLQRARWQHHPPPRLIFPLGECRATRVWFLDIPGNDCGRRGHSYKNNAGPAPRLRLSLLHRARWQHSGSGTRGVGYSLSTGSSSSSPCMLTRAAAAAAAWCSSTQQPRQPAPGSSRC